MLIFEHVSSKEEQKDVLKELIMNDPIKDSDFYKSSFKGKRQKDLY